MRVNNPIIIEDTTKVMFQKEENTIASLFIICVASSCICPAVREEIGAAADIHPIERTKEWISQSFWESSVPIWGQGRCSFQLILEATQGGKQGVIVFEEHWSREAWWSV